jgi:mutator protein MutT
MKVKVCTLLFLLRDGEILLAMKKRGFGSGRWNGVGGKIEAGETTEQAMIRECQEEIEVTPHELRKVAYLDFAFPDGTPDMCAHVFVSENWEGEPVETEEMAPKWFLRSEIPYAQMWSDDPFWIPQVLDGKLVRGTFTFDDNEQMLTHDVTVVATTEELA